ncbi:some similarities with Saccharomyces cerevisiae YGR067C Putative protein of unknown function [Maudiozyma barnettii]|uniref:C2H2-type domain-containing protein n=1 Tax=Maudiozyma barnettii TaxID=61262 RepID=A0A8H2VC61_9SACH|nr:hypothetical protein [Kazachstania barnettii]CAB4252592.1 some similarities with Saccharomyces cerevisiae YGR067C Putative protein of unknown function [Kazachstania barnettii]CAD1779329.1 some similarities with Saccharomyces cerevisiae YGR067C Putative protein of unknown function [Kazachstania barnettii]
MANSQRKYICSFCAKSFSRSEHRTRHERSHTGYKPFQCKICKHSFVRRDLVQRHIRTVHRVLLLASKQDNFDPNGNNSTNDITLNTNHEVILEGAGTKKGHRKNKNNNKKRDLDNNDSDNSNSSDDQTLDELVRQMIHVRDLPKENEREKMNNSSNNNNNNNDNNNSNNNSGSRGQITSNASGSSEMDSSNSNLNSARQSSSSILSDINDLTNGKNTGIKGQFSTKNILTGSSNNNNSSTNGLREEIDNSVLKDLYLNNVNDSFNSHLTTNVINKFHLSYYSDQLLKNFNFGITSLRDNQLFLNSIRSIYESCNYDNDKFFQKAWFSERDAFLPILGISISCLGNFTKNNVYDQNLWILCWNQAMTSSTELGKPDILSISILMYILLKTPNCEKTCSDVFQFYQQSLLYMINQLDTSQRIVDFIDIKSFDIWNIFDAWVLLTKTIDIFDNASSIIYKWFLKQNNLFAGFPELTLFDFLNSRNYVIEENMSLATLNILPDTLYCEANNTLFNTSRNIFSVGSFKSTEELHNIIIKINQKFSNLTMKNIISETTDNGGAKKSNEHLVNVHDPNFNLLFQDWKKNTLLLGAPTKFTNLLIDYAILPQSNNHWLLWECTWFEFLKSLSPSELVYKKSSFLKLQMLQNIYLDGSMINNNLALCTTPIIASLENFAKNEDLFPINGRFVSLIVDILSFQLKFFSTELVSSQLNGPTHIMGFLSNPMVQLILYVWFSVIYKNNNESISVSNAESDSVIYFVEKYIINTDQNIDTDRLLEHDINEILFNNKSSAYIGFHCLIDSIARYIKDEIIIKRLFPLPTLDQETRFKLFEFLKLFENEEQEAVPMVKTPSYSHRPSISSIGSNTFNLPTSPMSCTPTSNRRSSVVSVTEDGQKLLLPPLNFIPGQMLASPPNKRNSIPNSSFLESNNTSKVLFGTYNDTFGTVPQPILHSGNPNTLNHLKNYSYGGVNGKVTGNLHDSTRFNPHTLLNPYDDDNKPPIKWLQNRRASLPSLSGGKMLSGQILPSAYPIPVTNTSMGEGHAMRPIQRLSISKDRLNNENHNNL